jgi:hypothetical protein
MMAAGGCGMKSHIVLVALFAIFSTGIRAAEKPNLSGTWKLDPLRSRFDAIPAPKSGLLKIEHQEPKIHISVEMAGKTGASTQDLDLITDGTEQKVTIGGQSALADAYWEDDRHLVVEVKRDMTGGKQVETRRMNLGDKGKMLTTVLSVKDPSGQKSAYGFYVKE